MKRALLNKSTAEMTREELESCFEDYIQSKTVNGRFCPTPDIFGGQPTDDGGVQTAPNSKQCHEKSGV